MAFALPFAFGTTSFYNSRAFAVAPDGRRILVVQVEQQQPAGDSINTLQVIRNWPEEVKAKLAGR